MRHVAELEFKEDPNPPDDATEIKSALADLTKTVTEQLKATTDRLDDIEKKQNRSKLLGSGGLGDQESDAEKRKLEQKALSVFARTGEDKELKAYSVGGDPEGGYFTTPVMSGDVTKRLFDQSPMRRLARIVTITTGDAFEEPLDMNDLGATWVGEQESRPETAMGLVGMLSVPVHEVYALQPVTQRLLDDSQFDIGGWLSGKIADKFGRSEGAACVVGTGHKQPWGFMTFGTDSAIDGTRAANKLQYVVSGDANLVTADGLRDLYWSLRAPHRVQATWLMASATANAIDKMKDGNGDYLWRDGITAGAPPSLLGRPVEFDENMPAIGAGNFPIAFGDFKRGYIIVDKAGIKLLRDPFSDKPRVLFYAYRRVGGSVANFDAIKLQKISA
ncbi:MAG TPA: phage major capsid protein [Pirellulales bacterium]